MGYDTDRFKANVEDFQCPICKGVLEDPLQIKDCEHMFCHSCITHWIDRNPSCPVDRTTTRYAKLTKTSRFFQNLYNQLQIKCKFNQNGCQEIVAVEKIISHEVNCPFSSNHKVCDRLNGEINLNVNGGHKALIESLKRTGVLTSIIVEKVMLTVERRLFCSNPYDDHSHRIGYSSKISAPRIHARILELLKSKLTPGAKVLDIGSGSGYLTICMALMLSGTGKVIGVDHVTQLIDQSNNRISKYFSYLNKSQIEFVVANGRFGYLSESPYDVINIGDAMDGIPQIILDQLKPNGRIVVPLCNGGRQKLVTIDKLPSGRITFKTRARNVKFGFITDL